MSIEEEWEGAEKLWGLVGCVEPGEIDLTKTIENTGNTSGKDKRGARKGTKL